MKHYREHTFAICAYKESPYLESCIQSVLHQSIQSNILMETSTPCNYISALAEKYQIPLFVNTGKGGITEDWNYAIAHTKTKLVTVTHQDDIYDADYLESMLDMIRASKHPLIAFSDYYEIRDGKKVYDNKILKVKRWMLMPLRRKRLQKSIWIRRRMLSLGSPICCPSVTYVLPNLPEVIFRNHFRACEDWEAWEMISGMRGEFLYCPKPVMGHRIHAGSETSAIIGDHRRSDEEYEMFRKFWPAPIAGFLTKQYAESQKSNNLNDQ